MMRICVLLIFLMGCESRTQNSSINSVEYAEDVFVALNADQTNPSQKPWFTLQSTVRDPGFCVLTSDKTCRDTPQPLVKAGTKGDLIVYQTSSPIDLTFSAGYGVTSNDGSIIRKFKFVSTSGGGEEDPIEAGLAKLSQSTLESELGHLASDSFNGRLAGTEDNDRAADWIIGSIREMGIQPVSGEQYKQKFRLSVGPMSSRDTANIVGLIEGNDPELKSEYVIIGAHMDHAGTLRRGYTCSRGQSNNDICNGADDNGSGTIALLNVAKALSAARKSLKRSVVLIWFSGEEEGLLGSSHYVNREPLVPLRNTVFMINLDMVGYARSFGGLAALGGSGSTVGNKVISALNRKYGDISIRMTDRAGGGSDHVHFMSKGIPGVFYHTGVSNNPNYHKTGDTADKIDYRGMLLATKIAFETVVHVANDSEVSYSLTGERPSLVTDEELNQTCHHLIQNPFLAEIAPDFSEAN